jgi:hypothetical protein
VIRPEQKLAPVLSTPILPPPSGLASCAAHPPKRLKAAIIFGWGLALFSITTSLDVKNNDRVNSRTIFRIAGRYEMNGTRVTVLVLPSQRKPTS